MPPRPAAPSSPPASGGGASLRDQVLTAPDGRLLARYQRRLADDDRPMADLVELADGVQEAEAVPALMAAFAGWRVERRPRWPRRSWPPARGRTGTRT